MTTKTFKRYEIKYFVTPAQYTILCQELKKHMRLDPYCTDGASYMIYNLYFDTPDNTIIRHSLAKPYYKEKLRLRSYQMPTTDNDLVFLELKKKIGGIVAKRRAVLHYPEALAFISTGIPPQTDNYQDRQVALEIVNFLCRYTVLPKVYISYERVAYFGKVDKEFRVSFDKNILSRRSHVNLYDGDYGTELLADGLCLMEIKCAGAMPLWLTTMLSAMQIYPTSFSKYGTEYKRYMKSTTRRVA